MATIADYHIHGFDISSYQPAAPNFAQGGRQFAIFKATEGGTLGDATRGYKDPHLAANRLAAHAQNMLAIGLYHFAHPTNDPRADALHFLWAVGKPQKGEFAVLDYETSPWNQAWIVAWANIVKAAGWKIVFYTYAGMLSNPTDQIVQACPDLWIAGYSSHAPGSDRWPHWTFWQHTDGQPSVSGNDGPWDCSVFYSNDTNILQSWVGSNIVPPAPVPVEDIDDLEVQINDEEDDVMQIYVPAGKRRSLNLNGIAGQVEVQADDPKTTTCHLWVGKNGDLHVDVNLTFADLVPQVFNSNQDDNIAICENHGPSGLILSAKNAN